jgi:FkbM family methyltransferase
MHPGFQSTLFKLYRLAIDMRLLATPWGQGLFDRAYHIYKRLFEADNIAALRPYATPGSTVVDVGANIGFFALRFAGWLGSNGRVLAIEPEERNFASLCRAIARQRKQSIIEPILAAAAETDGPLHLKLNPYHPGDHKIADSGIPVTGIRLDTLLSERGGPPVSLIKIDVQGAEARVLAGGRVAIARDRPVLFIEIDDDALAAMGSSASAVLSDLANLGYEIHGFDGSTPTPALTPEAAKKRLDKAGAYLDFLFLPCPEPADATSLTRP